MTAGSLNTRLTIEQPPRSENELGEQDLAGEWTPLTTIWASVSPMTAREVVRVRQAQLQTSHIVRMRFNRVLTSDMRFSYSDGIQRRVLNISGIVNVNNRSRELEVQCVEVTNG